MAVRGKPRDTEHTIAGDFARKEETVSQIAREHADETLQGATGNGGADQYTNATPSGSSSRGASGGGGQLNVAQTEENYGTGGGNSGDRIIILDNQTPTDDGATKGRTEEEKRASFSRLASIRTSNALDAMRGLGHLANTTSYAFDREQIDKMLGALQASLDALRKNFAKALEPKPPKIPGQRQKRGERNLSFRL